MLYYECAWEIAARGFNEMLLPSSANIVILASNYNPSIVSKEWLYQKGIFAEAVKNFVHTPVFSLVESERFSLTVDEQRLQLVARKVTEDDLSALLAVAERFVRTLPETPYRALGFNYHYAMPKERYDLDAILCPDNAKIGELLSPNYGLGATVLFDFEKFIVTLTISPSFGKQHQVRMSLNFHSEARNADEVVERLPLQTRTLEKAEAIIRGLCKNG